MTGSTLVAPPNSGTWTIVHDSNVVGQEWGRVSWNSSEPGDSSITVTAASSTDGVNFGPAPPVVNGADLTVADGQYLKVSASFSRSTTDADGDGIGDSAILYDLTIDDDERNGEFSCRATGLKLLATELGVANAPDSPCEDDSRTVVTANLSALGLVMVKSGTINASTDQTPDDIVMPPAVGDKGVANASLQGLIIKVGLTTITADLLTSTAKVECGVPIGSNPGLTGSSQVVNVKVNGNLVASGNATANITIPLVGILHVNHQAVTANSLTRRALWLQGTGSLSAVQVAVAEAKADFTGTTDHPMGNPCQ